MPEERRAAEVTHQTASVADTLQAGGSSDPMRDSGNRVSLDIAPGTVLDGAYKVVKRIGGGAMGTVYLVEHQHLGRRFAAKVVASAHSTDPEIIGRLRNEARVASSIQHENIVDVVHLGRTPEGSIFVVMELLEGHDLRHRLVEQEAEPTHPWLPDEESRRIARDVLVGLHAAHEAGIVHRDLKPDNIFLSTKGGMVRAKLVDFGISKGARGDDQEMRLTRTGQIIGTPLYMAPEQTRGTEGVDRRADIYAIGVILYEMTTGRLPFEATSIYDLIVKHATETPPPARERRPDLPEPVEAVVMRCLEKSPDDRFQTAREVLDAWEKAWNGVAPSVRPPKPSTVAPVAPTPSAAPAATPAEPAPASRWPLAIGAVVVLLVVGGVAVFGLGGGSESPTPPSSVPSSVVSTPPPPSSAIAVPPLSAVEPPPPATGIEVPATDPTRTVASDPEGATVEVAGEAVGTTPVAVTLTGGAPVEITVRMPGRRPVTRMLTTDDPDTVSVTLERVSRPPQLPGLAPH